MTTETSTASAEIARLWRHLFSGAGSGLLQIWTGERGADGRIGEDTINAKYFNYPKAAKSAALWALDKSQEGRDVFFCAHLLTASRRIKANAANIHALWAEIDGADVPNGQFKPTALIESSPGRWHCYWRLSKSIDPAIAEDLNKRLAKEIGADEGGFDLTQLLRLPGTSNYKYADNPVVRVAGLDGKRTYEVGDLQAALKPLPEAPKVASPGGPAEEPPVVLGETDLKVWRGEEPKYKADSPGEVDTSATLMKVARTIYDAGATRATVVAALAERDETLGFNKYTGNRDGGQREYERIYEKLAESGRNTRRAVVVEGARAPTAQQEAPSWPVMGEEAYRGIFGEIVELVDPHTEADPVAVLVNALLAIGNALGRGPFVQIGATRHRTNLFAALVGETAKGRKGSSWSPVKSIMHAVDADWVETNIASGLSSGEGLISEVRDPVYGQDKDGNTVVTDPGVQDKRLLVVEGELSQSLKVMKREGNTLSPVLRNGWDGETLRTMVKGSPHRATDPHISILGHITVQDLTKHLTETEMANGLANRFLWILARRSKSLPFGGEWHTVDLAPVTRKIHQVLEFARPFRMEWGDDARDLWSDAYELLSEDSGGMFGAVTARAEAQALRLSMLYALADCSREIRREHIEGALEVWQYAETSAKRIFGDSTGDPDADRALEAIKAAGGMMTRTDISVQVFGRNKPKKELDRIREALASGDRITVQMEQTPESDKRVECWRAT